LPLQTANDSSAGGTAGTAGTGGTAGTAGSAGTSGVGFACSELAHSGKVVYVTGSSASKPFLQVIAQQLVASTQKVDDGLQAQWDWASARVAAP